MEKHQKNPLIINFFNEDLCNLELYNDWHNNGNPQALTRLNKNFKDYLYKIKLLSYLKKSLSIKAWEIKRKKELLHNREELSLNILDPDFNEERINNITQNPDYIEEIYNQAEIMDFAEIISDKKLVRIVNQLTGNQKNILFKSFIEGKKDKVIAKELDISIQAVNKTKKTAIRKIQKEYGGVRH